MIKTKQRTKGRIGLTVAAVIISLLELISVWGLVYAYREMKHEGLTYSQWYEGTIYGFYSSLMICVAVSTAFLLVWYFLLRNPSRRAIRKNREKVLGWLAAACAAFTVVLIIITGIRHTAIGTAAAQNAECLEPYIRSYGNSRTLALLAFEGSALLLACWIKARRSAV